ncbi:MAG: cysteine desulfurase [Pseudomonadales bacterium]|nr:cysteine desulfurase [Pseudomonadales bacterium]
MLILSKPLYLDNASTTAVASTVLAKMISVLDSKDQLYANPSSVHALGLAANDLVSEAREKVASLMGCESREVIFTSGATEANNIALMAVAQTYGHKKRHIITSLTEHKSVLEPCKVLEQQGFDVTYLKPDAAGRVDALSIKQALRDDTLLVSLMYVNNETGVLQPIDEVAALLSDVGVLFHVDASQAVGKFKINLNELPVDLLSMSAHKFYGPKGIGCLIVKNRSRLRLKPIVHGGGQEFGLRSGTLPTHQIVGLSTALDLSISTHSQDYEHVVNLKSIFLKSLKVDLPITVHSRLEFSSPYILNFSIEGVWSDALINQLINEVAISSGSACSSGTVEPSYVLRAMGVDEKLLYGAVRVSFSRENTIQEVQEAAKCIALAVQRIKEIN